VISLAEPEGPATEYTMAGGAAGGALSVGCSGGAESGGDAAVNADVGSVFGVACASTTLVAASPAGPAIIQLRGARVTMPGGPLHDRVVRKYAG
jgi:hypothetical protein